MLYNIYHRLMLFIYIYIYTIFVEQLLNLKSQILYQYNIIKDNYIYIILIGRKYYYSIFIWKYGK